MGVGGGVIRVKPLVLEHYLPWELAWWGVLPHYAEIYFSLFSPQPLN